MPTPSPSRMHDFEVIENKRIAEGIFSMTISAPKLAESIKPGQFVNIAVPGNEMELLRIPLSYVSADPDAGTVEIWYAVVGNATERMSAWKPGFHSDLLGPGGKGWGAPADAKRALLVSGGIGVPPVLCLARELASRGVVVDVCTGAKTASELVGVEDFREIAHELRVCTDDGSCGFSGFTVEPAAELIAANGYDYVATCGPSPMMERVAELAVEKGVYCEASLERMMSCGFGACSTCNVETVDGMEGACMCGPVFDAKRVVVW